MKKKWSKIWKEFNNWWSDYSGWPFWSTQQRKLTQLIHVEFPSVNTRKLWACFNSECNRRDNKTLTLSWKKQQNVIKNAVATQRSNNG